MQRSSMLVLGSILLAGCTTVTPSSMDSSTSSLSEKQGALTSEASSSVAAMEQAQGDVESELAARTTGSRRPGTATSRRSSTTVQSRAAAVPAAKVINVTADNWSFSPSSIVVKKGDKVQVRLTGKAGIHGFAVPALGINQRVEPGQTITVTLLTDKTGTFSFFCSIPCGQGHRDMRGSVTIQP